jgi:hypothetical protein
LLSWHQDRLAKVNRLSRDRYQRTAVAAQLTIVFWTILPSAVITTVFTSTSSRGPSVKPITLRLSLAFALSSAHAHARKEWDGKYSTAKARYLIYSGSLGDSVPPQAGNKKLSLMIGGRLAPELFDSLNPDQKEACGASTGVRIRERGDVTCSFHRGDKVAPFTCHIGINLKTGKSMAGAIC